jgi:MYXO-CTERM domain-containing protein
VSAWQQHDDPVYESERRAAARLDRDDLYQPRADPRFRFRELAATLLAFCLGLAVLYFAFGLIGAADFGDSIGFTVGALVLAGLWALGAWQRRRRGGERVNQRERERRGF